MKILTEDLFSTTEIPGLKINSRRKKQLELIPKVENVTPKELIKLRKKLNCSRQTFAALLGVDPSTIQYWEKRGGGPRGAALRLINLLKKKGVRFILED